jgi:hypothetical protein
VNRKLRNSSESKTENRNDLQKPFEGQATSDFILTPEGNGTKVTWRLILNRIL